jgi:hypothetical protein
VEGSPDGISDTELHKRAMDVVTHSYSELLKRVLTDFEKRSDRGRVSFDGHEVISRHGKVE